jgi:hypothetical protein
MTRDYHDFTTIDTPVNERRELNTGDIWINEATCHVCGNTIRSKNRHNYVTCQCGNVSVDGGSWYVKRSYVTPHFTDNIVMFTHQPMKKDKQ